MLIYPEVGLSWAEVPEAERQRYESRAAAYWDSFYKKNENKFYKDRHYFDREFPELLHGPLRVMEVGCGAGNSVFPLLELNAQLQVFACDFSPKAVQLVQAHPAYASGRVTAFVADITQDDLTVHVPPHSLDFVTMVFVLSAISPERMHAALANVARVLKPGSGRLLFRDYAQGDLAQERHQTSGVKRLSENFYVRGDGTRCFYFSEPQLAQLCAQHGFACLAMKMHERDVDNHKRQITMHRRWVQAVFQLTAGAPHDGATTSVAPTATPKQDSRSGTISSGSIDHQSATVAQRTYVSLPACEPLPTEECAPVPGSWLVGAAGRLATKLNAPGVPSGRAQLPLSLESAEEQARSLKPHGRATLATQEEDELDKDFFEAIARDAQEVVEEEIAAGGGASIRLAEPLRPVPSVSPPLQSPSTGAVHPHTFPDPGATASFASATAIATTAATAAVPSTDAATSVAATIAAAAAASAAATTDSGTPTHDPSTPSSQRFEEVSVCPGFSLGCAAPWGPNMALEVGLASLLAHCPHLLTQRAVLEMEAGAAGIAALAGVRHARRYVAAHPRWPPAEHLPLNLRHNSPRVVVERLRVCPADLVCGGSQDVAAALRQAPDPPGCYDIVVAAGLVHRLCADAQSEAEDAGGDAGVAGGCGLEGQAETGLGEGPAAGSGSGGLGQGGLRQALASARQLVTAARAAGLSTVRSMAAGANSSTSGVSGSASGHGGADQQQQQQQHQQEQQEQQQQQRPVAGAMCVLLEVKGALQRCKGQLQRAATAAGWAVQSEAPKEVLDWLAQQQAMAGMAFEAVVMVPLVA